MIKTETTKVKAIPFKAINAFMAPTFIIQGTINHVGNLKTIQTKKGAKSFFYMVLSDYQGSQMKLNFWETDAIKYADQFKKEQVYQIEKLRVYEPSDLRYATYGPYELVCSDNTKFTQLQKTNKFILPQVWNFVENIASISSCEVQSKIDTVGIVTELEDAREVTTNGQKRRNVMVRSFSLLDHTGKIKVSLWAEQAEVNIHEGQIVAIKMARVTGYRGRSLSVAGFIEINPKHVQVDELIRWKQEKNLTLKLLTTSVKNITKNNANLSQDWEKAATVSIKDLQMISQAYSYTHELPTSKIFKVACNIKRIQGNMFYAKKNQTVRWCLKLTLENDEKEWLPAIAFEVAAANIMRNLSAEQASELQKNDFPEFMKMIEEVKKEKYIFRIYCKENVYLNAKRLQFIIEDLD